MAPRGMADEIVLTVGRRVLVVNYDYPPSSSVGGVRWFTMKKYLEQLGYEVFVLTTNAFGKLPSDADERVTRAPDLVASSMLRRTLRRPELSRPGRESEAPVDTRPPRILTDVFVPDVYAISWVPAASRQARRLIRERRIDILVTSSPKDSTHLVGLATLKSGVAWVADFRDGWVFESTRPPLPTRAQRALDERLEAAVVRRADAVVAMSDVLAEDFGRRHHRGVSYVPNGWDPELAPADEPLDPAVEKKRGVARIVYTGTLTGAGGAPTDRTPLPLLEALSVLAEREPRTAGGLELVLAGRRTERDNEMLARFSDRTLVRDLGYLPRPNALALQRSADVLLLVSGNTPSSIPLKLFEYLGTGKPILHLGRPGAADDVLTETGAGITVSPDDPEEIISQLGRVAASDFTVSRSRLGIERYSYPYVAESMLEVLEGALQTRDRRLSRARR